MKACKLDSLSNYFAAIRCYAYVFEPVVTTQARTLNTVRGENPIDIVFFYELGKGIFASIDNSRRKLPLLVCIQLKCENLSMVNTQEENNAPSVCKHYMKDFIS